MERKESRKEKLARLLAENKTKLEREKLVKRYEQEIDYRISADQFIDLKTSHSMKKAAYQKIATVSHQEIGDFQSVINVLRNMKRKKSTYDEINIFLYYMDTMYTGGIYVKMKDFWNLLEKIKGEPLSDIVIIENKLAFGLCVEIEEYCYLLTNWGFEN